MDISMAYSQSRVESGRRSAARELWPVSHWPLALSRSHKRQPRFRQLQLGGVEAARFEANAQPLQRMPRGNLRVAALVDEPRRADAQLPRLEPAPLSDVPASAG